MSAKSTDFLTELKGILAHSEELDLVAVEVRSGNLHQRVGGYPGKDHRMPVCCDVMYAEMRPSDSIITKPNSGKGASLVIRYCLPR
jgi:5-methylcytosine-specific restriction protein A